MWLLAVLACGPALPHAVDPDGPAIEHIPSDPPGTDTATSDGPDDDALFVIETMHTVDLSLSDAAWNGLERDPYSFVEGDVRIDSDAVGGVGVRLRGKIGSFRAIGDKPKFKIEFDEFAPDQRFRGLKALALNNEVVDCSYLKEVLGYRAFAMAGVPAPRTSFAQVTVNGDDYGLYVIVEVPDDEFLEDRFADPSGNLYDGKYLYYGGYSYTLLDFASGVDDLFPLEEGTDVGNTDIAAVSTALLETRGTAAYHEAVGALVDWPAFHTFEAAEQWIGHVDGYAMNQNNYRVYFDPASARMGFIPWDLDYAFYEDYEWGFSWASPRGAVAATCWQDATCYTEHAAAVPEVLDRIDTDALLAFIDAADTLTLEIAKDDPKRECAQSGIRRGREQLRTWVSGRSEALAEAWEE